MPKCPIVPTSHETRKKHYLDNVLRKFFWSSTSLITFKKWVWLLLIILCQSKLSCDEECKLMKGTNGRVTVQVTSHLDIILCQARSLDRLLPPGSSPNVAINLISRPTPWSRLMFTRHLPTHIVIHRMARRAGCVLLQSDSGRAVVHLCQAFVRNSSCFAFVTVPQLKLINETQSISQRFVARLDAKVAG